MYVWRMGAYVWFGDTRLFFLLLLAAWSRDCALRVRFCDEAVFLSFRGDAFIYLFVYLFYPSGRRNGRLVVLVCVQTEGDDGRAAAGQREHGWLGGEGGGGGGGGSGRRKGLENKKNRAELSYCRWVGCLR